MTPAVCRAARALAGLTQRDLAAVANMSAQTIADFERGARKPHPNNLLAIRRVFEERGIKFNQEGPKIVGIDFQDMAPP